MEREIQEVLHRKHLTHLAQQNNKNTEAKASKNCYPFGSNALMSTHEKSACPTPHLTYKHLGVLS